MTTLNDIFGEVIHTYSRAQAIEDGVLVELPDSICREAGITFPVACTREVYESCVAVTPKAAEMCNDLEGRTWDVLWMLWHGIKSNRGPADTIHFELRCIVDRKRHNVVRLKAVCGPNDDGSPCITIMFPEQD